MLAEERFNEIIHIVEERQTVTVQELTELLHTSESTIRRDLTELHKRGKIVKVHGGATVLDTEYKTKDSPILERQNLNIEEKMRIAKEAAERIQSQDFVYIDAGTSTGFLVDCIKEKNAGVCNERIYTCEKIGSERVQSIFARRRIKGNNRSDHRGRGGGDSEQIQLYKRIFWDQWCASKIRIYDTGCERSKCKAKSILSMQRAICSCRLVKVGEDFFRHLRRL